MKLKVIVAAGGTGGHVFPALAIAEEIRDQWPDAEILFVGTKRGLEDRVIPKAGFKLKTIVMSGLARGFSPSDILNNLAMPFKLLVGLCQSAGILLHFRPQAIVGCGGYVTGPIVMLGVLTRRKTFIQEQNSRPGKTTVFLARFATQIHLTYEEAAGFIKRRNRIMITGNPIRKGLRKMSKATSRAAFGLAPDKTTLLVVGGSLGARSINRAVATLIEGLVSREIQLIWQTGKHDYETMMQHAKETIVVREFLEDMSSAYSAADLVLCRAGAMTLSEITAMGLPSVLVPYPHAAENHQEYNAQSLVRRNAAVMVRNDELTTSLQTKLLELLSAPEKLESMGQQALTLARPDAARQFVRSMETALHAAKN